jgi:EthD domain
MAVKVIFFLKRKKGTTPEHFRAHYESSHVKLAQKYIGHLLLDYKRNYPTFAMLNPSNVPPGTQPAPYDIGYDCITEMWVKDEADLAEVSRIFNDPVISPILVADELRFLQRENTVMLVSEEIDTGTKLAA